MLTIVQQYNLIALHKHQAKAQPKPRANALQQ